ncbi:DEAD/DEAH box helicase [Lactobacillus sp. PV034]|uniref:DEAD/DEAH box helicase n=1 Tax=Lactobacillus sp. PV034 TaxID=2594495 RepID=UPI002240287B|nr:helicase-related protein [Lactobacillus sp. PV034]QNQ81521.1 DEAD/DEAH box helicase [Lactobacillus sp. PV034]
MDNYNDTIPQQTTKVKAIQNGVCQRCHQVASGILPDKCVYCRQCIGLGRIDSTDNLIRFKEINKRVYPLSKNSYLTWHGKLTDQQEKVSEKLQLSLRNKRDHLVHAVTGAGKTEMLFKVINAALIQGLRVGLATPRIDVVNELYPRLCEAFKTVSIGKYHGKEFCEPQNEQFIICTTHQLLKFYRSFDLLIIDEVDSFPYVNNPMLLAGARFSVKKNGVQFYLTATPDPELLEKVRNRKIDYSRLNRRFHGGLLPVPENQFYLRPFIKNKKINYKLLNTINHLLLLHKPILIFIPRISELEDYKNTLAKACTKLRIATVYAGDKERQEKVQQFRDSKIDILLTTTILERGVTFPHVQVIVVAADDKIYTTPSLVQIAGRVGRSMDDKSGKVIFCYHRYTKNIRQANRQIREMNQ